MKRIVEFYPAWDKRDPDPKKNYGINSVTLGFFLKGELGVIQFKLSTGWFLPQNKEGRGDLYPYPTDIGYHSPKPMYEDHEPIESSCHWLDGKPCYYDGSSLRANGFFEILVSKGSDGLWKALEQEYIDTFGKLK